MKNPCILIPSYNESRTIGDIVRRLRDRNFAVFVADDGSTDGTADKAAAEGAAPEPSAEEIPMPGSATDVPDESLTAQFLTEFNALVERLRQIQPGYTPPPFATEGLLEAMGRIAPDVT